MSNYDNQNIVEIILDNNALQHLCGPDYNINLERISKIREKQRIRLHFNGVVFYDRIKGLAQEYFEDARELIRKTSKICNKTILMPVREHLIQGIKPYTRNRLLRIDRISRDRFQAFAVSKNYRQAYNIVRDDLSVLKQKRESFLKRDISIGNNDRTLIFNSFISKYKLGKFVRGLSLHNKMIKLKSLIYLTDVDIYYRKRIKSGVKPKESDYDDLELIPYLNICDYIISEDKVFRNIIDDCGNIVIKSRAISAKAFVDILKEKEFPLKKRAVDRTFSLPIIPNNDKTEQ